MGDDDLAIPTIIFRIWKRTDMICNYFPTCRFIYYLTIFYLQVTIADIHMVSTTRFQEDMGVIIDWELVPKIKALVGRIEAEPKIADWIEKRPKSSKWKL